MYGAFIARVGNGDDIRICSGGAYSVNGVWSGSLQSYFEMQDLMGRLTWQDPNASTAEISKLQYDVQQRLMYGNAGYSSTGNLDDQYVGDFRIYRRLKVVQKKMLYMSILAQIRTVFHQEPEHILV